MIHLVKHLELPKAVCLETIIDTFLVNQMAKTLVMTKKAMMKIYLVMYLEAMIKIHLTIHLEMTNEIHLEATMVIDLVD